MAVTIRLGPWLRIWFYNVLVWFLGCCFVDMLFGVYCSYFGCWWLILVYIAVVLSVCWCVCLRLDLWFWLMTCIADLSGDGLCLWCFGLIELLWLTCYAYWLGCNSIYRLRFLPLELMKLLMWVSVCSCDLLICWLLFAFVVTFV